MKWTASDTTNAKYLGLIEFRDDQEDWHFFEILQTSDRLVFGGACNVGFLESGYMPIDEGFSIDENLRELLADLETYYNDGPQYTTNIVFNQRM